ncbi:MAG: hypothetical protein ACT4PE_17115, partial [Candidatus Eiseniibacteriota bacterium]
ADRAVRILTEARRTAACAPPLVLASIATSVALALGIKITAVEAHLLRAAEDARRLRALQQFQHWTQEVQALAFQDLPQALARGQALLEAFEGRRTP